MKTRYFVAALFLGAQMLALPALAQKKHVKKVQGTHAAKGTSGYVDHSSKNVNHYVNGSSKRLNKDANNVSKYVNGRFKPSHKK